MELHAIDQLSVICFNILPGCEARVKKQMNSCLDQTVKKDEQSQSKVCAWDCRLANYD